VPRNLKRYYGRGDLHFITFSCYQRLPLLASVRRRDLFLSALEATRRKYELLVVGYVVMPEHVHLLVAEPGRQDLSTTVKALKAECLPPGVAAAAHGRRPREAVRW